VSTQLQLNIYIYHHIKAQIIKYIGHVIKMDKEKMLKRITVETICSKKDWWTEVKVGGYQRGSGKKDSELD
jgi:hypothetical protein